VQELNELQRQGMSIQAISKLTGWDRKTVRKYLLQPSALPEYGPRRRQTSKLDPFKPYLAERMRAGVWNAQAFPASSLLPHLNQPTGHASEGLPRALDKATVRR